MLSWQKKTCHHTRNNESVSYITAVLWCECNTNGEEYCFMSTSAWVFGKHGFGFSLLTGDYEYHEPWRGANGETNAWLEK